MACRCEDIRKGENDKRVLCKARAKAGELRSDDNSLQGQLQVIINGSPNAYTVENSDEIGAAIDKLNDEIEPTLNNLVSAINWKIKDLEMNIAKWQEEDNSHHEAEALAGAK